MLRKLLSILNIIFGLYLVITGIFIFLVFFELFSGYSPISELGVSGVLGLTFFLGGIPIFGLFFLTLGVLYVWLGYRGFKKPSKATYYAFIVMLVFFVTSIFQSIAGDRISNERAYIQNQKDFEKVVTNITVNSEGTDKLNILYSLKNGTEGNYLVQTKFKTDGPNPELYDISNEVYLKSDQDLFTETVLFKDLFAKCTAQKSDNWICVGLNRSDAGLQNINTIKIIVKITLLTDSEGHKLKNLYNNENITEYVGDFKLNVDSSLSNIQILK